MAPFSAGAIVKMCLQQAASPTPGSLGSCFGVRQELLDSEQHECPVCHETDISPNNLIPNRFLRTAVLNFKNETGYTRIRRGQLAPASAAAASSSAASTCAASSPRATVGDEGSATPPPATQQPDEQEPDKPVDKPADKPAASPVKKSPASGTEEETPIEKVDGGAKLEVAGAASLDDTSRSPAVGTPGENPPGTPLADENPEEPAGPSLDEALTMSPQHRSHDESSPPHALPTGSGSPSSLGNGEESVCAIRTITTRVTGPIAVSGSVFGPGRVLFPLGLTFLGW
ncbi:hypothetical protein HPB51_018383 [Rhipicephalus microplus]|uniref:Uncharacterized protein n=1 Tax=Rhipicephalus microplus TaxID=6941 RepID=A0A9J6EUM8_RHIMP|nr:hypothetical protein HPB51_018383 [Rhipicephalus microplus]